MIFVLVVSLAGPTLLLLGFVIDRCFDWCHRRRIERKTRLQFIDALMDQPWRDN